MFDTAPWARWDGLYSFISTSTSSIGSDRLSNQRVEIQMVSHLISHCGTVQCCTVVAPILTALIYGCRISRTLSDHIYSAPRGSPMLS